MTLALYGKSRRRQGALITAALLAVIIAAVGALGAITPGGATPGGGNNNQGGGNQPSSTGNIQVHKYLPKDNPQDKAPWQNQGNGQGQWTFSVYKSQTDAQNGTNPIATFSQLGSNSPDLPQTELWIKETGMPSGYQFFAWFVPDGDNNSGNDKCSTKPLDDKDLITSTILHIPAIYWSTKGNRTGLFHICAYNMPIPTKTIKICKKVEDNGDGYTRPKGTFVLTVTAGNQTTEHEINAAEGGQPACEDVKVPASATNITVGEAATRPAGWNGDADGYPKVSGPDNSGTYTVTNKEKPIEVTVTFVKMICETFKDVPKNPGTSYVHVGAPVVQEAVEALGDTEGKCKKADNWTFQIWSSTTSNGPWPGDTPSGGTLLQTAGVGPNVLNSAALTELLENGRLFVKENYQNGYMFAALKCEGDTYNNDNWEWIKWSAAQDGQVTCIAYNVPAKLIRLVKTFYGVTSVFPSDYPTFTISDLPGWTMAANCTAPVISLFTPVTAIWACTVPYSWKGTVTETPAPGWEACKRPALVAADFSFTNCKQPSIVVKKVVTNVTNDTTRFTVTLNDGQSSQTDQIAEHSTNGPVNATFSNLSLGTSYTVTESSPNGYQVLGWAYANDDGTCPLQQTQTGAAANVGQLSAGETKTICFYNQAVGNVVIVKYENVPPDTAQTWTFTGTVPSLPQSLNTTGTTNSVGTAITTISNVPAGSYTVAETQGRGRCETGTTSSDWETHGLVQVGGSQPDANALNNAPVIGSGSLNVPVQAGQTTYVVFGNIGCGSVLSAANLQVNKFSDPFANFTGTTPLGGWTITITGTAGTAAGFTATQQTNGAGQAFFLGIPDGTYTVCETLQSGWANVGSKYNTVTQAGLCRTGVTVNLNQTATVDFYNQPRVTIRVHKKLNVVGFTSNGQGWQFTLTGCGITPQNPQKKTTGPDGIAEFTNLPPAIGCSYTVTETVQSGWTPQSVSQTARPVAGGQVETLEFLNIRTFDPPCVDPNDPRCVPPPPPSTPTPTPTGTPTTPTTTTTPPPTATPTNTPTPTPTNTPVTQVAGERTPGPGASPTPLAPSTGYGFGGAQGGMSLLLVLAGLISLSLGLAFLALSRRTNR